MNRDCERARQWASVELDGELSRFERALLDAHLADCRSCADFHASVGELTHALRAAPLERFDGVIEIGRAWRRARLRLAPVAAAMAVAAVGLGSILASTAVRSASVGSARERAATPSSKILETMDLRTSRALAAKPQRQLLRDLHRSLNGGIVVDEP
jgi:predicted anti-sigma-YlaC factor YlaD